jgi:hypothetical protein
MRVLVAFVLGFAAAVGGAFVHDNAAPSATRPFVNWDVVGDSAHATASQLRVQWDRLTSERR